MGLSSGRFNKNKAPAELPSLLEHHLPKRARGLVSPLSDDDREVLTYMLAFGLHLQMLAGVVGSPTQKLQQKSSFSAKVGLKHELNFASSQPFSFFSSKSRTWPMKPSGQVAHKTSCSCDCFSCYSSFWSRWAASPNRDLLSAIIEMAEMGEEEEDCKRRRGKENTKKQGKKHVLGKGKKCKGDSWTQPDSFKPSLASQTIANMDDSMPVTLDEGVVPVALSVDALSYDALCRDVCIDEAGIATLALLTKSKDALYTASESKNTLVRGVALMEKASRITFSDGDAPNLAPSGQGKNSAVIEKEVARSGPTQALSPDILQSKSSSKLHCTVKRKSNQIMPLDIEGTFIVKDEEEELGQLSENGEGDLPPRAVDASTQERGVLSQVFPYTLGDIAARLWDLVSLGPRSHTMEYF